MHRISLSAMKPFLPWLGFLALFLLAWFLLRLGQTVPAAITVGASSMWILISQATRRLLLRFLLLVVGLFGGRWLLGSKKRTEQSSSHRRPPSNNHSSNLTIEQARAILNVSDGASRKEIIAAHKKLIQRNHPDKGGSAHIAQQINEARDILLQQWDDNERNNI